MKWLKGLLLVSLLLVGCSSKEEPQEKETKKEVIQVLAPSGAPALGVLPFYKDEMVKVEVVQGTDIITAELAKENSKYDVIVAPINIGTKLLENKKTNYYLDGVLTWGNLYLVGTNESALQESGEFAAFGEAAVPGMMLKQTMDLETLVPTLTYYNAVTEVQAALLSGKAKVGLMAEPAATATIAKGKESGKNFQIIGNLQKQYQEKHQASNGYGYPQAAIFVKEGKAKVCQESLKKLADFTKKAEKDEKQLKQMLDQADMEMIGVPNADITLKTWKRQNIHYVKASEVTNDIKDFLSLFQIKFQKDMISK